MKPFVQTTHDNCFATCVASILEIDQATVPNFCFMGKEDWRESLIEWLIPFGLYYVEVRFADDDGIRQLQKWGYHVISGRGPRGCNHSVVGLSGSIVHDPYPDGGRLLGVPIDWEYGFFVATDPSLLIAAYKEKTT